MNYIKVLQLSDNELDALIKKSVNEALKEYHERNEMDKKYINREEAADILRVTPDTISKYVQKGWLTNHGKGRVILLLRSEVIISPQKIKHSKWKR